MTGQEIERAMAALEVKMRKGPLSKRDAARYEKLREERALMMAPLHRTMLKAGKTRKGRDEA